VPNLKDQVENDPGQPLSISYDARTLVRLISPCLSAQHCSLLRTSRTVRMSVERVSALLRASSCARRALRHGRPFRSTHTLALLCEARPKLATSRLTFLKYAKTYIPNRGCCSCFPTNRPIYRWKRCSWRNGQRSLSCRSG
jgi:hypothetical protein